MSIDERARHLSPQFARPPSVVFFGRRCRLSEIPLERLVSSGVSVESIIIPASIDFGPLLRRITSRQTIPLGAGRPALTERTVDRISSKYKIPIYAVRPPLGSDLELLLREISPDLIVVSCFPWRVPHRILRLAGMGAINLHPSPLPQFRGPDPLFWAFQTATRYWGTTVHQMNDALDSGPILGQCTFPLPDGIGGDELETLAAQLGSNVLLETIDQILTGCVVATPQDESQSSYFTFPDESERTIPRSWTVQRTLNFVAGVLPLGHIPLVATSRGLLAVRSVVARANSPAVADEAWVSEDVVRVRLQDGVVDFTVNAR